MNNRISLQDLAALLASETGQTKKASEEFLREFVNVVSDGVFTDNIVKVKGLGTFKIIKVEDRESVNVNTGKRFILPGHYKFNFTPDKDLKDLVNKPFSFFDTTEINDDANFQTLAETTEEKIETIEEEEAKTEPEVSQIAAAVTEITKIIEEELPVKEEEKIITDDDKNEDISDENEVLKEEPDDLIEVETEPPHIEDAATVQDDIEPIIQEEKISGKRKASSSKGYKILPMAILILLALAVGVFAYIMFGSSKQETNVPHQPVSSTVTEETLIEEAEITPIEEESSNQEEPVITTTAPPETQAPSTILANVKIEPGSRLTLLALEYYGNKIFWVYIYEHNKAAIDDPNNVPVGTELSIPAPELYDIDAKSRTSIEKASALQTKIIAGES